ncbi:MAG: zinc-binding alcohol dehydrogenase family protein [Betaproteobacteria bacterium]|nr:MAG: zinc-binding alcohol dehydrogenase family protein [Betaproteobacteria bacterium]
MGDAGFRAMRVQQPHAPLRAQRLPMAQPGPRQVLIQVRACGVCRTDLHIADGELAGGRYPVTPGHEIVGSVVAAGAAAQRFKTGERVGVPWLGETCGDCEYCRSGRENLCDRARFTGFDVDGGYAEYCLADERFCFSIPERYGDAEAAPLLCAGLIGYRTLAMAGDARRLGIYGFGAAAHLLTQVAKHQGRTVHAFGKPGDLEAQRFARRCGADWAGDSLSAPPEPLDAAIIFAPVGALVPQALQSVRKGGVVVCGGIHMSDIPAFAYALLWGERRVQSVANLTRADGEQFMRIAADFPLQVQTTRYALDQANAALADLRAGRVSGAAVLTPRGLAGL